MAKIGNFATGMFVLGALALLAVMLWMLGMKDLFVNKAPLTTFFSESVQGLSVGADVKYKGAKIGSVKRIVILPQRKLIQVDMEVDLKSFLDTDGKTLFRDDKSMIRRQDSKAFYAFLRDEIKSGLRCRLEYAGITGLRYLDFDYFAKPGEIPEDPRIAISGLFVPSAPSALRDVVKSLNTSMERISKIRFEEISDNLVRNLDNLNKILSSEDIQKAITHLRSMAKNMDKTTTTVNQTLTEERLRRIVDDFEQALADVRKLVAVVREDAEKSDLAGTSASVRRAADNFSGVLTARSDDLRAAVDAWLRTMEICRELMDNLNRDPASVVRGRRNE